MYTILLFDPAQVNQALFLGAAFRWGVRFEKKPTSYKSDA